MISHVEFHNQHVLWIAALDQQVLRFVFNQLSSQASETEIQASETEAAKPNRHLRIRPRIRSLAARTWASESAKTCDDDFAGSISLC